MTNPYDFFQSIESSSDLKYDLNVTQPISTRISKKLHELREKLSKYTTMPIQLLEGSDDFSHLMNFQIKYQTSYNHALYGAWSSSLPIPNVRTEFSFCGNRFMISKSNIDVANIGLFILSYVHVPPK